MLQSMCMEDNNNNGYQDPSVAANRIKQVDSDFEKMDDYDMEEASFANHQQMNQQQRRGGAQYYEEEEKKQPSNNKSKKNRDNNIEDAGFNQMMKQIDQNQNNIGMDLQSSFLGLTRKQYKYLFDIGNDPNQSFSVSYKEQRKLERQQKKLIKQMQKGYQVEVKQPKNGGSGKKHLRDGQQQMSQQKHHNEENKYNIISQGGGSSYSMTDDGKRNFTASQEGDIKYLMKYFTIGREVIEEVYEHVRGDRELAFEKLEEIEEIIVAQNEEDLLTIYNGSDDDNEEMIYDPEQDHQVKSKRSQQQFEQDRKLAEELQRQEKLQREKENEKELMEKLNVTEEQLSDLKILEMLHEFLFKYRFEQKAERLVNKKNVTEKDLQMQKPKSLSSSEQHVFQDFLKWLQTEQFNILANNAQIKSQLINHHGYTDEELKQQQQQQNNSGSKITPGGNQQKQQQNANNNPYVNIDNKRDFPDLISEQDLQKHLKQQKINQRMNMHNRMDMQGRKKFQAFTALQEQMLYEIQDIFKALDHDLIQEAYFTINDAELLKKLFKIAFPNLMTKQDLDNQQMYEQIFKYSQQKQVAENRQAVQRQPMNGNNRDQPQGFFTDEILRRFKYMNKQRSRPQTDDDIYETSRLESQKIYAQRKHYLNEFQKARKAGNQQQAEFAEKEAEKYRIMYEQSLQKAQMSIFQMKNSEDTMDYFIDLHGIHLQEAITILNRRLQQIQVDLDNGTLKPNINDGQNHVLKIVCGKGLHSKGRPVLKVRIPQFLSDRRYEYYNFEDDGVVLVRLQPRR